jgi:acyl carrier protein phosphodiesterase
MNFLAHIYLSGENVNVMIGNFIGDFVKGRNLSEQFEPEIVKGIEIHRAIDAFTDTHPIVRISKKRLQPKYRHYAPVIVDVFYDHFLAKNWDEYHPELLPDFAERTYKTIESFSSILPNDVLYMLPYMIKGNWLVNYSRLEGIQRALTGMSRRTTHVSHMDESVNDLREHSSLFEKEFREFFPELKKHVDALL